MSKFILVTRGTGGDLYPFIHICQVLTARGHDVTLITDSHFEKVVKSYGLDFVPLHSDDQGDQNEESAARMSRTIGPEGDAIGLEGITGNFQIFTNTHNFIINRQCDPEETILVSHENLLVVCQTIAEILRLRYAVIFMAPYFLMRMPILEKMCSTGSGAINQLRAKFGLPPVHDWSAWLKSPSWKIGLWPEWFAPDEPAGMFKVSAVGFVWNREFETGRIPEEVKEFLVDGEPAVLITHGTSKPDKPNFFRAGIEGCEIIGRKGIVVTPHDEPGLIPHGGNVRRYRYLPFASLLPHVGAVIHHGGIGTLNRALAAGIPQLVLAFGYDRPDNGARLSRLGAGECLPPIRWQPHHVAGALRRLITHRVQARCRQLSLEQTTTIDAAVAVCDLIDSRARGADAP